MRSIARDYAEQTELLNTLHEKAGQDIFVAKHTLMRRDDDTFWTWTTWVEGVTHALLPKADFVAFGRMESNLANSKGFANWESVMQLAGHRMEATDLYPTRYRLRSFPTEEELTAMGLAEKPV